MWKKVAIDYTKRALAIDNPHENISGALQLYRETFINGKYYLWKLYLIELLESFNQLNNLINVYLCFLPIGYSSGICFFLGIDSLIRGYEVSKDNTPERRDRQIKIDIFIDTVCMIGPLCIIWFGFKVPISIDEIIFVTLFPALCLFSKLRSIFREIVRLRSFDIVKTKQAATAKRVSRNRRSIYAALETTTVARKQQNAIPKNVRKGFAVYNIVYGIFMFTVAIVQLSMVGSKDMANCQPLLWKSCLVKTPFCANLFQPKCNCAVLNVRTHNWTEFPPEIYDMNALKVMRINHGPLETLPTNINKFFKKVSRLDLSFNKLKNLPGTLGRLPINQLYLENNELNMLPDTIWGNKDIFHIELDNNNISVISPSILASRALNRLFMSNNSLYRPPVELFALKIVTIYTDGNRLNSIPAEIGKMTTLQHARFNNNQNITNIPEEIGNLIKLQDIDFRNNAIESLPNSFESLNALKYIYLHDNPICSNGWIEDGASTKIKDIITRNDESGCVVQCSIYCPDMFKSDKVCDSECNSVACKFDGGDC
eukprot:g14877.t1